MAQGSGAGPHSPAATGTEITQLVTPGNASQFNNTTVPATPQQARLPACGCYAHHTSGAPNGKHHLPTLLKIPNRKAPKAHSQTHGIYSTPAGHHPANAVHPRTSPVSWI